MDVLNFTFASIWHFAGVLILVIAPLMYLDNIVVNLCKIAFIKASKK